MKVTVITIVIGAFGTVTKGLVQGLEDLEITEDSPNCSIIEIVQNTEKSPGDFKETCSHPNSSERTSADADVKNSQGVNS